MGICKFQKVFGFSNLYKFFLGSTHIDTGVIKAWCADPWWIQQVPIYYRFWSWNRFYQEIQSQMPSEARQVM